MTDEEIEVVEMMEQCGGSFVRALAQAFWCADRNNFLKLKIAFPEYWKEYKEMVKK